MIDGVEFAPLDSVVDHRGDLTVLAEVGREPFHFPQWNVVRSAPGVLRGMHAHSGYDEYYVPLSGPMWFGLADLRPDSPSYREAELWQWDGTASAVIVPKGVAHGVYCDEPMVLVYGLSSRWDGSGEYGCRFDDPELGLDWPCSTPILSERDQEAGTYHALLDAFGART